MTREEAMEILQAIKFIDDFEDYSDRLEIAIDMAIEALKERPHGEWIEGVIGYHYCSKCRNYALTSDDEEVLSEFCPYCGTSMSANDRQVTGKLNSEIENSKSEIVPDYRDGWRLKEGDEK